MGLSSSRKQCDIGKPYANRRFVQVAELVEVTSEELIKIKKAQMPRYAYVPGAAARSLVADLDRVMTIDKREIAAWARVQGCSTDEERRTFAQALRRHKERFAFPDEHAPLANKLKRRIERREGKASAEGRLIAALDHIRVLAEPTWWPPQRLTYICLLQGDPSPEERREWASVLRQWQVDLSDNGWCDDVSFVLQTTRELSLFEYNQSDRLDYDHISKTKSIDA